MLAELTKLKTNAMNRAPCVVPADCKVPVKRFANPIYTYHVPKILLNGEMKKSTCKKITIYWPLTFNDNVATMTTPKPWMTV